MMSSTRVRSYNFWFLVERSEDVPGEWTSHCLELDVVSQGASLHHAIRMLMEACTMVVTEDLAHGRDPLERRAPEEFWSRLYTVVREGRQVEIQKVSEDEIGIFVGQASCLVTQSLVPDEAIAPVSQRDMPLMPLAWEKTTSAGVCSYHPS